MEKPSCPGPALQCDHPPLEVLGRGLPGKLLPPRPWKVPGPICVSPSDWPWRPVCVAQHGRGPFHRPAGLKHPVRAVHREGCTHNSTSSTTLLVLTSPRQICRLEYTGRRQLGSQEAAADRVAAHPDLGMCVQRGDTHILSVPPTFPDSSQGGN